MFNYTTQIVLRVQCKMLYPINRHWGVVTLLSRLETARVLQVPGRRVKESLQYKNVRQYIVTSCSCTVVVLLLARRIG
jgi:hypothetical protein